MNVVQICDDGRWPSGPIQMSGSWSSIGPNFAPKLGLVVHVATPNAASPADADAATDRRDGDAPRCVSRAARFGSSAPDDVPRVARKRTMG
jgi:hypothetical protein